MFMAGGVILFIAVSRLSEYCSRFKTRKVSVASSLTRAFTKDSRLRINAFFSASSCGSVGITSSNGFATSKPSSFPRNIQVHKGSNTAGIWNLIFQMVAKAVQHIKNFRVKNIISLNKSNNAVIFFLRIYSFFCKLKIWQIHQKKQN